MTLSQFFRTPSGATVRWQTSFPMPRSVNLGQNVALAKQRRADHRYPYRAIYNAVWMINRVRGSGHWDYKLLSPPWNRRLFEPFGNFHYGVVMTAADWPSWLSQWGAGAYNSYQMVRGRLDFRPEWVFPAGIGPSPWQWPTVLPPHGDHPDDQFFIGLGVEYARGALEGTSAPW